MAGSLRVLRDADGADSLAAGRPVFSGLSTRSFGGAVKALSAGWAHDTTVGLAYYHVWPLADLMEHDITSEDCVCGPTVEHVQRDSGSDAWMIIHQSLDRREVSEEEDVD